jgi:signal transduction histidine kinase
MIDSTASSAARLAAARARLVAADAESQRIQRALHDGVQQDLIAMSVQLQLARRLADSDPPAALALLEEMGHEVREALHRVQALGEEIYPGVLDARGLPDALTAAAAAAGVPATVEATGLGRHPADVEMAFYICGLAALENVATHAGVGARATVRLGEDADMLSLEIADNGSGFDPAAHPPNGGLAMARDRIEALDGRLTVESQPGRGTCVEATIPRYETPER